MLEETPGMPRPLQLVVDPLKHLLQRSGVVTHPRIAGGTAAGAALTGLAVWLWLRSRRPSADELERRRRDFLTTFGRLTDGSLTDSLTLAGEDSDAPTPEVLLYRYRIAGVTYDCAQDVSMLPTRTAGYRLDQPVQVRYDRRNPGNSIIASEGWSGLRLRDPSADEQPR